MAELKIPELLLNLRYFIVYNDRDHMLALTHDHQAKSTPTTQKSINNDQRNSGLATNSAQTDCCTTSLSAELKLQSATQM